MSIDRAAGVSPAPERRNGGPSARRWIFVVPVLVFAAVAAGFYAGLGLNPITDGQTIRLPIPELTEERRKELAKLVGQYAEKARIAVRNVRRDGMEHLKADEKKHEISEDERKRLENEVQKLTDETIKEIDETAATKEMEILGK